MGAHEPPPSRSERRERVERGGFDTVVVGGGITGVGIALDLALRGVDALVVERGDWGGATSSASSRLIHGGLRYLEQFELGLVRDSCLERGRLLDNAAGYVWPETFLFPIHRGDRVGRLKLASGLALYGLLSIPRSLGVPGMLGRRRAAARVPGIDAGRLRGAGHYLDGATDDARLTLAVTLTAIEAGATALSRTEMTGLDVGPEGATVRLRDLVRGDELSVDARTVVLAGGPFTEELRARADLGGSWISPTRGAHVVVPRERLPTDGAVIFPSRVDGRVMFLIPWPRHTVVGTTDLDADPSEPVRATREEVRYLLDSANGLVPLADLTEDDVVSTWAGLRPLLAADDEDPSARSREERVTREGPVFTIAGGKLTGYRSMAEKLGAQVAAALGTGDARAASPTRDRKLVGAHARRVSRPTWSRLGPGGEPDLGSSARVHAWNKRYAARAEEVRKACDRVPDGAHELDAETLLGEVDWAVEREDCLTLSDFFLRRSDLAYGPRDAAEAALDAVEGRMAELLGWSDERRSAIRQELVDDLDGLRAWRSEPPPDGA